MENLKPVELERIINKVMDESELTRGLEIKIWKTEVVFEEGNNWASYIEPKPAYKERYQPSPEAKKMLLKLLSDMRLKYNLL